MNPFTDPQPGMVFVNRDSCRSRRIITYITGYEPRRVHFRIEHSHGTFHHFSLLSDWERLCLRSGFKYLRDDGVLVSPPERAKKERTLVLNRDPFLDPIVGDVIYFEKTGLIRTVTKIHTGKFRRVAYVDFTTQNANGRERKYVGRTIGAWKYYCMDNDGIVIQKGR